MSKQLQELVEKLAKDEEFASRLAKDTSELKDLGWSPEAANKFNFEVARNSNCGTECGCGTDQGSGGLCTCGNSGGSGAGKKPKK